MVGKKLVRFVVFGGAVFGFASLASAQQPQQEDYRSYLNIYNRPTVSPYLALVPQIGSNGTYNAAAPGTYQSFVKPQVDLNDNRFRQSITAQNQPYVPSPLGPGYQAKNSQTTGISNSIRPTGHDTRNSPSFMNLSHYYPGFAGKPHR